MPVPIRVVHDTNPASDIHDDVGGILADFQPLGARVLVVIYERGKRKGTTETRTASGRLIIPDTGSTSALGNDKYQGKVGLVIKLGPLAFVDDDGHQWGHTRPAVGDWVMFQVSNTQPFDLPGDRRARYVEDVHIDGIVPPDQIDAVW